MEKKEIHDSVERFEKLASETKNANYVLRLYIAGNTPASARAIMNIREICETHLKGRYQLEVIDIYQQPALARQEQIIATPTLVKLAPRPKKILIGNLVQKERVLACLGLAV